MRHPDDTKSITDGEKASAKVMEKNSLSMAYLYEKMNTSKCAGCLAKASND